MRVYEFSQPMLSVYTFVVEFCEVPVSPTCFRGNKWPDVTIFNSQAKVLNKSCDDKEPASFSVLVTMLGDDLSVISKHVKSAEIKIGEKHLDGWQCNPYIGSVTEITDKGYASTTVIHHDMDKYFGTRI